MMCLNKSIFPMIYFCFFYWDTISLLLFLLPSPPKKKVTLVVIWSKCLLHYPATDIKSRCIDIARVPICLCETKIIGNGIDRAIHVGSILQSIKKLRKTCEQISSNHRIVIAYHEKIFSSPRQQPAGISRICFVCLFF